MERKEILTVVLILVLLVVVGIQTVELVRLSGTEVGMSMPSGSSMSKPVASGSANVPTSLQNLPTMVGGC